LPLSKLLRSLSNDQAHPPAQDPKSGATAQPLKRSWSSSTASSTLANARKSSIFDSNFADSSATFRSLHGAKVAETAKRADERAAAQRRYFSNGNDSYGNGSGNGSGSDYHSSGGKSGSGSGSGSGVSASSSSGGSGVSASSSGPFMMEELSDSQRAVIAAVERGGNVFFTGAAGIVYFSNHISY
jgi:hypothetical protein